MIVGESRCFSESRQVQVGSPLQRAGGRPPENKSVLDNENHTKTFEKKPFSGGIFTFFPSRVKERIPLRGVRKLLAKEFFSPSLLFFFPFFFHFIFPFIFEGGDCSVQSRFSISWPKTAVFSSSVYYWRRGWYGWSVLWVSWGRCRRGCGA